MKKLLAPVVLSTLLLTSCANDNPNQTIGTLLGGAGGAALGSQFGKGKGQLVGVAIGTLAGAFIGGSIGKSMDDVSRMKSQQTTQSALETAPTGQVSTWHNPDQQASGSIVPTRTYQDRAGGYCREFQQTVMIGGKEEQSYGTACRQPDGSWKIVQ